MARIISLPRPTDPKPSSNFLTIFVKKQAVMKPVRFLTKINKWMVFDQAGLFFNFFAPYFHPQIHLVASNPRSTI